MDVGGIFGDSAKAFECMNHEILLAILHLYAILGVSEYWFRTYLTNRRHKVEVNSPTMALKFFSDRGMLKHGVPQVVGPLLFIIYINDLPLTINSLSEPVLFPDDTSVIISSRNFRDFCSVSNVVVSYY